MIAVGIVAVITTIGGLFFVMSDGPKYIFTNEEMPPVSSLDFGLALSAIVNSPLESGGDIEVLENGDPFTTSLLDDVAGAKHSINFSIFIWEDGVMSDRILDALLAKQREGVKTRILLDGLGAKGSPKEGMDELRRAGATIETFRSPRLGKLTRYHRRNHRRAIIIDGQVGYTGGVSIYDKWLGNAQNKDEWRDLMFRLEGSMARSLQAGFVDLWATSTGEILVGEKVYISSPASTQGNHYIHLVNSPADDDSSVNHFLLMPIMAARNKVHITTPYFIPDQYTMQVLKDKAKEGVEVVLILPGENIDNASVRWAAQNYYEDLLESGVKIYEYQPTFIHSKIIVVDSTWSVMGSANINSRSRRLDEENIFGILDTKLASRLDHIFEQDLENSREIKLEEWEKRSLFKKIMPWLSRIIKDQS